MQADLWKALLRSIPEEHLDNLMLMTAQGTEVNVQAILRMDEQVVILRGRLAGSNDAGRIFILPYEHFDHIGFQRPLTDAQLQAIFGIVPVAAPPKAPEAPPPPAAEPAPEPGPPPAAPAPQPVAVVAPPTPPAVPGLLARLPSKSKIIQRLRQRAEAREAANSPPKE
jgi:hypothetical protein